LSVLATGKLCPKEKDQATGTADDTAFGNSHWIAAVPQTFALLCTIKKQAESKATRTFFCTQPISPVQQCGPPRVLPAWVFSDELSQIAALFLLVQAQFFVQLEWRSASCERHICRIKLVDSLGEKHKR